MRTDFPTKKTFEQDFLEKNGKNLFTLKYEQASILEYYEYLEKSEEEKTEELLSILSENLHFTLKEKILKALGFNFLKRYERLLDIENICINIFKNRYRSHKSIFDGLRGKFEKPGEKNKNKGSIESVGLSIVCKEYNISPTDLMKNYTLEQYFWFLDGIEWKNNAGTPEGELLNQMAIVDKEELRKRRDITKERFEKFKKIKK